MDKDKPAKFLLAVVWAGAAAFQCAIFVFVLGHGVFEVPVHELWQPAWVLLALDAPLVLLAEPTRQRAYAPDPRPGAFTVLWYLWGLAFCFLLMYYGARFGVISWKGGLISFVLMVPIWGIAAIVMYRMLKTRPGRPASYPGQASGKPSGTP